MLLEASYGHARWCLHTLLACAVPFPSPLAYARLWVDDHLLYPRNTTLNPAPEAASSAPLWLPLPPRALQGERVMDTPGAAPLANYTLRVEYACLAAAGCAPRAPSLIIAPCARSRSAGASPPKRGRGRCSLPGIHAHCLATGGFPAWPARTEDKARRHTSLPCNRLARGPCVRAPSISLAALTCGGSRTWRRASPGASSRSPA